MVFVAVGFFVGAVVRFFVVVVAFRVGALAVVRVRDPAVVVRVDLVVGFRAVVTGRFAGTLATAFRAGESGSGGRPRTFLIALLCCASVCRNSCRPSGLATKYR